jgi:GNAT superfamily N-acetyltransferase
MHQFEISSDLPTPDDFKALYDTTAWGPATRDASFYQGALSGSWRSRSAYCKGQLVGFARAISDGHLHAFITEMIIRPEFQHQGMGSALLASLLEACHSAGITDIQLFCAKGKADFYVQHGFVPRPTDAPGMQFNAAHRAS